MKRFLHAAAAAALLTSTAMADIAMPSGNGLCAANTPDELREQELRKDDYAMEQSAKASPGEIAAIRAANADEIARAKAAAEAHLKTHPAPEGIRADVVDASTVIHPADGEARLELDISVNYSSIEHSMVVRRARFDGDGKLISDDLTPVGRVWLKSDSYAAEVGGRACQPTTQTGPDGTDYIAETIIRGPGADGKTRVRGHLWFNEDGYVYRGEKFDANGVSRGGFEEPSAYPDQGMRGGERLETVEVPRLVTLACSECQSLADRRNAVVERIVPLASDLNWIAKEHNGLLAAREATIAKDLASSNPDVRNKARQLVFTQGPELRSRYQAQRARYDAAMAELNTAHAEYMSCEEQMCRKPAEEPVAQSAGPGFEVGVELSYEWVGLPDLAFLGRETPGASEPTLGLFESENEVSGTAFGLDISIPFEQTTDGGLTFRGRIRISDADSRAEFGRTDLTGDRLVIPGLGEGPNGNGFVFNYFAGLNSPENVSVTRDFVSTEVDLGVEKELAYPFGRIRLGGYGGYEAEDHEADFFAAVPGFARDIGYEQDIDVDAFKLGLTVALEYDLDQDITLGFEARGAVVFADWEGTNRLTFTGFAPQIVDDEGAGTSFDGDFTAFLEGDVSDNVGVVIAAGLFYSSGTPVWSTPGGGTRASIETDDSTGVFFSTWLTFRN